MTTPFGEFGAPPDAVAWTALTLALLAFALSWRGDLAAHLARRPSDRLVVAVLAVAAALLSVGYVHEYLRGGPRIIDATSYFLQARALAEGHVVFPVLAPSGSFRGRFLLADPDGRGLTGIFPPGYPAVLALGFLVRQPMLVGPLIGAVLVVATYALARRLTEDRVVARLAAALSVVCVVLRYHTADTMSHGWSALLLTVALWSALGKGAPSALLAGTSAGWLVATRPVSGAVAVCLVIAATHRIPRRTGHALVAAAVPVLLFVLEQRVATGGWLTSTQGSYYAVADGPERCFRYGFGANVGCLFEHGDFVRARLPDGYGALAALGTLLRRLKMHLADAGNAELFAPVLAYAVVMSLGRDRLRLAAWGVLATIVAYIPFYFDGNYPGGGARFFADALPLEHVLVAWALVGLGAEGAGLPVALAGFALHTAYDHRLLAEREGGRPMFEPGVLRAAGVRQGLVFVGTDHGFNLAYDPDQPSPLQGVAIARRRGDAHDAILWDRLGRPPAYEYEFFPGAARTLPGVTSVTLWLPSVPRFEAEAEWPLLEVARGSAMPVFPACASDHRAVSLRPSAGLSGLMRLEVLAPRPGRYRLVTGWVAPADGALVAEVAVGADTWRVGRTAAAGSCLALAGPPVELGRDARPLRISARSAVILDYFELVPAPGSPAGRSP